MSNKNGLLTTLQVATGGELNEHTSLFLLNTDPLIVNHLSANEITANTITTGTIDVINNMTLNGGVLDVSNNNLYLNGNPIGGGSVPLNAVLAIGNNAGVFDIDMNNNNIDNVDTISSDFLQNINILGYKDINITTQVGDVNINGNDVNINMTKVLLAGDTYLNINSTDNIRMKATGHIDISANVMNVYTNIDMSSNFINNLLDPVLPQDAATKHYVDTFASSQDLSGVLANGNSAGSFQIDMNNNKIVNVAPPTNPLDAVNKAYVDAFVPIFSGVPATAEFVSLTTQNIGNATPTTIAFATTNYNNNINLVGGNTIEVIQPGLYQLAFSAQLFQNGSGNNRLTYFWLNKNGIDISNSNSGIETNAQLNKQLPYVSYILDLSANDAIKIRAQANSPIMQLLYEATPAYGTAVPSIIVSIERLNNTPDISGIQNLQQVLAVGNSAGIYQIDMSGQKIVNLATPTNPGDAVNKAYVDALPSGTQDLSGVLAIGNSAGSYDINMNQNDILNVAGVKNLGNQLDIEADDVNIKANGLTDILNLTAVAGIQLTAVGAVGIVAGALGVGIGTTGIISIGSTNTGPGGYTTIEHFKFIDEEMSSNTGNPLTLEDITSINANTNTNLQIGTGTALNLLANTDTTIINAINGCEVNGFLKVENDKIGGLTDPNVEIKKTLTTNTGGLPTTISLVKDETIGALGDGIGQILTRGLNTASVMTDYASIVSHINLVDADSGEIRLNPRYNGALVEGFRVCKDTVDISGGANTGRVVIDFEGHRGIRCKDPILDDDVMTLGYANANYADISGSLGAFLPLAGGTMTGTTATINNLNAINGVPLSVFTLAADGIDISSNNGNVNITTTIGNVNIISADDMTIQSNDGITMTSVLAINIASDNQVLIDSNIDEVYIEDVKISTNTISAIPGGPPNINIYDVEKIENLTGTDINMKSSANIIEDADDGITMTAGGDVSITAATTTGTNISLNAPLVLCNGTLNMGGNDILDAVLLKSPAGTPLDIEGNGVAAVNVINNGTPSMKIDDTQITLYRPLKPTTILDVTNSPGATNFYLKSTGTGIVWDSDSTGMVATGGSTNTYFLNGVPYTYHEFTTSGTFSIFSFGTTPQATLDMVIVGAGGSGAYGSTTPVYGGGGGCGCAIEIYDFPLNQNAVGIQNFTITIGTGGASQTTTGTNGIDGTASSVVIPAGAAVSGQPITIDAPGGRGGSASATPAAGIASTYTLTTYSGTAAVPITPTGGSGGGAGNGASTTRGTSVYNFNMCNRNNERIASGAYGGGAGGTANPNTAGAPGGSARSNSANSVNNSGNKAQPGNGLTTFIKGAIVKCCQGGEGAGTSNPSTSNTSWGGGFGQIPSQAAGPGATYGSGGGGSYSSASGAGANGVVYIRYRS